MVTPWSDPQGTSVASCRVIDVGSRQAIGVTRATPAHNVTARRALFPMFAHHTRCMILPMSAARVRSLPAVGTLIAGKYQTVRILGEGGMGCVYEAKHVRLGQRVALKFLQPRLLEDHQAVGRFEREARNASALRSAYTARIFDVDQTPDG